MLQWTEVPLVVAVMENVSGDIVFIDDIGWAWKGATYGKAKPVLIGEYSRL